MLDGELHNDLLVEFDWDEANKHKNWKKHKIFYKECEEVFFNQPFIKEDTKHSAVEKRSYLSVLQYEIKK